MKEKTPKQIIGTFEQVAFPEFSISDMTAKIDTGAYTGALHCTKISETEVEKGRVLKFSPFDHPEITITTPDFALRNVTSSNGKHEKRYFIKTQVTIRGNTYPITLSLADRSEMKWPVLIGRRFLRRNHFLVDANQARNVS